MVNWLASNDAVVLFTGGSLLECNEAALRLFGYSSKTQFLAQFPADLFLHPQPNGQSPAECLLLMIAQAQQEGVSKTGVMGRKADGSGFFVNFLLIPEQQQDGGSVYCSKWLPKPTFDLGELEQTADLPAESSEETAILYTNRSGEIIEANGLLCHWLGYEPAELQNKQLLRQLAEDPAFLRSLARGTEATAASQAIRLRTKDQSSLPFTATPARAKNPEQIQLLLQPAAGEVAVGEAHLQLELERLQQENRSLKRLQKTLRNGMERLRVLAEYSPDVLMQFDRKHRHLFVNSQIEKQLPYKVKDFLGKTPAQMGLPEGFTTLCTEALEEVFTTGHKKRLDVELPTGQWVDWFLIPEFNSTGEVVSVITTARDISEQKKTEAALLQSQRKLVDACEVTRLSSWEYEVESDKITLNPQLRSLLGIKEPLEQLSGRQFLSDYLLAEEHGKIRYLIRMVGEATHEDFKEVLDYRIRRQDGTIIHVLSSVRLELNAQGELVRAYGTGQDITQLRLTEQELEEYRTSLERLVETRTQELRKSEEKLADALRLANLGTWEYDPVAECFLVSDEVLEIFGTTREIEGGNIIPVGRMRESIYPEDRMAYIRAVERATESRDQFYTDRLELRIRRSDGEIRHMFVSIKIGKTRNFIKYYGTLQDISNIRKTEHEKDRLTAIIETTSDIVGIADTEGRILYLNKAGKEFFGIQNQEVLQQKTFFNFQSHKFSKVLSRKELRHADQLGTWSGQNRYLRYDGREIHVSQVIVSHKNAEGQVECYSTILRDMSEQKKIEQDLIFKNNELDTFIYRASHDLRGPIATLLGLNQIVKYEVQDGTALKYFDLYNSQIMRLHNITVSLIELTKIKDRSCEISSINFKELWQKVKADIWKLPESSDVLLHESIEPIENFNSDAHLLHIILYNLVENAIRYRRSEVESFARIEIQKSRESAHTVIKVSDNGIGIDGELQHKIYNMFFRGTERSKGPGLGLYILKNAVEKIGGRITLYSVPYKGTTFKIELPSMAESKA